jgi:hypothetical protein
MITSRGNPNKVVEKPALQSLDQKYHMKSPGERTRQLAVRGHRLTVMLCNQNRKICSIVYDIFYITDSYTSQTSRNKSGNKQSVPVYTVNYISPIQNSCFRRTQLSRFLPSINTRGRQQIRFSIQYNGRGAKSSNPSIIHHGRNSSEMVNLH